MRSANCTIYLFLVGMIMMSCATPYQTQGFTGGFSQVQYDETTYKIAFKGNAYTPKDRVETYLLYRCAEITAGAGYDYFIVVNTDTIFRDVALTTGGKYTSETDLSVTELGNTTHGTARTTGTYTPPNTTQLTKYSSFATIKLFRGTKPADNPNTYIAKDLLQYMGPSIKK